MSNETTAHADAQTVRVAIPSDRPGGLAARRSGHFGRCDCFTIVDLAGGQLGEVTIVENMPHSEGGCMAPVLLLAEHMVDAIVVDGIGGRPLAGFAQVGIAVHSGLGHTVEHSARAFALDQLPPVGPEGVCQH